MLDTILVGADGRPGGDDALALGRRLSQLDDGALVVTSATITVGGAGLRPSEEDEAAARHAAARARAHAGEAENITFAASDGPTPAAALQALAAERGADVIVVGASHRSPVGRVLGGSVLTELLRGGTPVAVAPRGYAGQAPAAWRTVAVAVDDTEASDAAVRYAAALTHVVEEPPRELDVVAVEPEPVAERLPDGGPVPEAEQRRARFDTLVARAEEQLPEDVRIRELRAFGAPERALVDVSAEADVLICGAHGRGTLGRMLFGSVSEAVAAEAACPLIVVPVARDRVGS